jgi:hypothetical protein
MKASFFKPVPAAQCSQGYLARRDAFGDTRYGHKEGRPLARVRFLLYTIPNRNRM